MRTRLPDLPYLSDPKDEPPRTDTINWGEFLERTRRYHKLTKQAQRLHYARGLDTKPEDMA